MKKLFLATIFTFAFFCAANAQTDEPKIEILQTTANECARCFEVRKAQTDEIKILKETTIPALEKEIYRLREELALKTGELLSTKSLIVEYRAMIDFLMKNGRIKKYGLINF